MTVTRALILYLSPWNTLSWPTDMSKRLRDVMRGGLWSSFSVFGAGTCISAEPNDDAGQLKGRGAVGVARTPLQVNPASDSWSAESGISPTLAAPMLMLFTPPRTSDPGQSFDASCPKHGDRKSTRLNSSHLGISYAVFCLEKKHVEVTADQVGPFGHGAQAEGVPVAGRCYTGS